MVAIAVVTAPFFMVIIIMTRQVVGVSSPGGSLSGSLDGWNGVDLMLELDGRSQSLALSIRVVLLPKSGSIFGMYPDGVDLV